MITAEESSQTWPLFTKYFNGQHALEKIAVCEGFKRKKAQAFLAGWEKAGVLIMVRHW